MRRINVLPNLITAFGLACGLFVIFKMNMIEPGSGYYEVVKTSVLFLLLAGLADFVDGAIARILKAESDFGIMFDSLADTVSFGVAPAVLVLKTLSLEPGSWQSFMVSTAAMIFSLCGVLRLARFNAQKNKSQGNLVEESAQKQNFTGLPIPAGAAAVVSLNLLFLSPFVQVLNLKFEQVTIFLSAAMVLIGYLMVSRLKFPSLKRLRLRVPSFNLVFFTVLFAIIFFYGLKYYFAGVLAVLCWGYVLLALVLSLIRRIAGKKSKTLEDFEPEPDLDETGEHDR
ncbi:MAG: CDP-diacylglycerol--serine O-phosphatidyltransferase [Parachlamydiales bacterium]